MRLPCYYLALSLWLRLGHGVLALRALSVAAMALAVLPLYSAARRLFDARIATVAGLLFATTPLVVGWAQKARPYALQTFFCRSRSGDLLRFIAPRRRCRTGSARGALRAFRTRRFAAAPTDLGWLACALAAGSRC